MTLIGSGLTVLGRTFECVVADRTGARHRRFLLDTSDVLGMLRDRLAITIEDVNGFRVAPPATPQNRWR